MTQADVKFGNEFVGTEFTSCGTEKCECQFECCMFDTARVFWENIPMVTQDISV